MFTVLLARPINVYSFFKHTNDLNSCYRTSIFHKSDSSLRSINKPTLDIPTIDSQCLSIWEEALYLTAERVQSGIILLY